MLEKETFKHEETGEDFLCREATRSLFGQPDVLLINEYLQVYQSKNANAPEMRLIAAVLEDAIACYLKYYGAHTRRGKRICNEAAQWIFSREDDWLFGFDNICEMLRIDPDYIRRILRQITQPDHFGAQDLPPTSLRLAS
jgi:transcription initiation factor TFIIIB Brf1 subunit/transcription initiation factor TFIIB